MSPSDPRTRVPLQPFYDRDGITIYNADCRDVLPHIDPDDVGLLLTDPPYGINVECNVEGRQHKLAHRTQVIGDDQPFDPSPLLRFPCVMTWGANHYYDKLPPGGRWIIWRKPDASPLMAAAEMAWHNCGKPRSAERGRSVDFFESSRGAMLSHDGNLHPTQKPVALMRWVVDRFTVSGDLVLDPYMGSGPVAQACLDLGRRYVGIEVVEDYCRVAVGRLGQQTLPLEAS